MKRGWFFPWISILAFFACGHEPIGENHGDLFTTNGGLVLTQGKHAPGWGRSECFDCHLPADIHTKNRTSLSGIDLANIQNIVRDMGESSCSGCHGTNGL